MIACFLFALLPLTPVIDSRCDRIELNSVYSPDGLHLIDQYIFDDFNDVGELRIVDWRHAKDKRNGVYREGDGYRLDWWDAGVIRTVRAGEYVETWSMWDREALDKRERRGLERPIEKSK